MGQAGKLFNIRQIDGSIEEYAGHFLGSRSSVGDREDLPPALLLGRLAESFKSRMPYQNPEELLEDYLNLALHLSGSAFRVELAAEPAPFREPTESTPETVLFRRHLASLDPKRAVYET